MTYRSSPHRRLFSIGIGGSLALAALSGCSGPAIGNASTAATSLVDAATSAAAPTSEELAVVAATTVSGSALPSRTAQAPPASQTSSSPAAAEASVGSMVSTATAPPDRAASNPDLVVATAWLIPGDLPDDSVLSWTPSGKPKAHLDHQLFGQEVMLPMCAYWNFEADAPTGMQDLVFSGAHDAQAHQYLFAFSNGQDAEKAFDTVTSAVDACGTQSSSNTHPIRTSTTPNGRAWSRTWTAAAEPGTAPGLQIDHFYIARQGNALEVLTFNEGPGPSLAAKPYDTSADSTVLARLDADARIYSR